MKKLIIILFLFLILLPGRNASAKVKGILEVDVTEVVRMHRAAADTFIAAMTLRHESIELLAQVIFWENWYTDKDKRAAYLTGAVVMNRVARDDSWLHLNGEKTVKGVVYAKGQYSTTQYFFTKEIPDECYEMARDIYTNGTPDVPKDVIFQATFKQGPKYDVINGEWFCFG